MDAHRHLARYKCIIPLHRCGHAENPRRRAEGRGNPPLSFTSGRGFNDYAGSAEVEHSLGPDRLPAEHREQETDGFKETRKSLTHCTGDKSDPSKIQSGCFFFYLGICQFSLFVSPALQLITTACRGPATQECTEARLTERVFPAELRRALTGRQLQHGMRPTGETSRSPPHPPPRCPAAAQVGDPVA